MIDDLDTVDWAGLHHAYGKATDVPDLVRAVAGSDAEAAERGRRLLDGTVIHQGTTYSASAPVVPFLARLLVDRDTHHRAGIAWLLGEMAAHNNQRTRHIGAVRAAVTAEVDRLVPLLADADAGVRGAVSFVLSQCPKRRRDVLPALRERFAVEGDPRVRALVLAAVQWLDPKTALVAAALGTDEPVPVRAAAALVLARSGEPWTPEATAAVRAGWAAGEPLEPCWWWGWRASPLQELVRGLGQRGADCAAVLGTLLDSSSGPVREQAAAAAVWVVRVRREARAVLVPVLGGALADASPVVRASAARALREAGGAARPAADGLARLAAGEPGGTGDEAAAEAVAALVQLDDPRWRALLTARLAAGETVLDALEVLVAVGTPFDPVLCEAVLASLDASATAGPSLWDGDGIELLASWGPAADAAVPHLLAVDSRAHQAAALAALGAIGPAAAAVLPRVRELVESSDPIKAGSSWGPFRISHVAERLAVWRIGGDPEPALDGARAAVAKLAELPRHGIGGVPYADAVTLLNGLGEQGRVLLDEVRTLIGTHREFIGLARLVWQWTGDADAVAPTVARVLELAAAELRRRTPQYRGDQAADLATELGDPSTAPLLRALLADPTSRCRVPAARAVWRLTADADGLTGPLLKDVTPRPPGFRWQEAFDLFAEMGPAAGEALPELREVAGHPWCPFVEEFDSSVRRGLGHRDDRFLAAAHRAVAAVSSAGPAH